MAKDTEEPDKKKAEQRTKEAKALQKELEQCKKDLAGIVAQVKQLEQKVG
jgi:ABC-type Zn uptake system ZnuABC Zn-binding protein ZnuA